jgi:hypothetical protein
MVTRRASKKAKKPVRKPAKPRSPTAAVLAKGAFRPRVVKSKRAYTRKAQSDDVAE